MLKDDIVINKIEVDRIINKDLLDSCNYETSFYYKFDENSEYVKANIRKLKITISHVNKIKDYGTYHKKIIPIKWAVNQLGYNDEEEYKEKIKKDERFARQIINLKKNLIPISEKQYNEI